MKATFSRTSTRPILRPNKTQILIDRSDWSPKRLRKPNDLTRLWAHAWGTVSTIADACRSAKRNRDTINRDLELHAGLGDPGAQVSAQNHGGLVQNIRSAPSIYTAIHSSSVTEQNGVPIYLANLRSNYFRGVRLLARQAIPLCFSI